MKGFIFLGPGYATEALLAKAVKLALGFVSTLPPKI